MAQTVASAFRERGSAPALIFPGRAVITYEELADRVARQVAAFGDANLHSAKKLIAIEAEHSEHAVIAYLAARAGGHAVAMVTPGCGAGRDAFETAFQPDIVYRRIGDRWTSVEATHALERGSELHPDLALLLMTSGSTGAPRGVRLSSANLDANAGSIAQYLGLTPADRACLVLPLHYSYGLSVLNSHLAVGASVYFPRKSILDEGFVDGLNDAGCTNLACVPYSFDLLETIGFRQRASSLSFMTVAGGRLDPERVRLYNRHMRDQGGTFFAMYGQTEATARIAYMPPALLEGNEDRIGIAIPGGTLSLETEDGAPIYRTGEVGELVYRGPNVMMGYAASRADLAQGCGSGTLRTGDLAEIDAAGLFRIRGRLKRISKVAGRRISHDGLEEVLRKQGISAAVVGDDRGVHAFFQDGADSDAVRKVLAAASGLTLLQAGASHLAAFPRLSSGKIDYAALRQGLADVDAPAIGPGHSLKAIFEQVFYPRKVEERDSFVSLDGDSLRFVQMSLALERTLGEAPDGWEHMTLGSLSARVPRPRAESTVGTDLLIRAFAILLVVIQHETLWPVPGGSAAMVLLAGFSLARFKLGALKSGDIGAVLWPAMHVLVPYYLIVFAYAAVWGDVPWASVLLVGNFGLADPVRHSMVPYLYWFIEAYFQMLLLFIGLFMLAPVRRLASVSPFRLGLLMIAAAIAVRLIVPGFWIMTANRQIFTLPWIFYLAAIGWSAAFADTGRKRLLVMAMGSALFVYLAFCESVWIGTTVKYLLQVAVLGALLYLPRPRVSHALKRLILPVSAASFHIYILHRFVPELALPGLRDAVPLPVFWLLSISGGIALGLGGWWLQGRLLSSLAQQKASGNLPGLKAYTDLRGPRSVWRG
ncbi:AMP-binding protein [Pararhizobium sp.]|uniref:AMP-binding protein n=1 Tax=Pararhizobium sp. TaxID=1977563 RepID=UPI002724F6A8|nr:AMP-binding protein [Pararhizobium sp.]MDO9414657.1 AMP-binding protein [Pararhizobium sp.]